MILCGVREGLEISCRIEADAWMPVDGLLHAREEWRWSDA
jgi:hypothetical protein